MKKTFLTFVAVGFGISVAFAQTAPSEVQDAEIQSTETSIAPEQHDRSVVELSALPQATQDAIENGEYSEFEVLAVYEIASEDAEGKVFEIELAEAAAADADAEVSGMEGVEIERVSARQPDVIIQIDENGQIIKEENMDDAVEVEAVEEVDAVEEVEEVDAAEEVDAVEETEEIDAVEEME